MAADEPADTEDVVNSTWRAIEADRDAQASKLNELAVVDKSNRVGRTVTQVGSAASLVVLVEYLVSFFHVDLAPLDPASVAVPTPVVGALIGLGTWWVARRMNPPG